MLWGQGIDLWPLVLRRQESNLRPLCCRSGIEPAASCVAKAGVIDLRPLVLRRQGSNLRPQGNEPCELPLLHSATLCVFVDFFRQSPALRRGLKCDLLLGTSVPLLLRDATRICQFFRQSPALRSRIEVRFTTRHISTSFTIPRSSIPILLYPAPQFLFYYTRHLSASFYYTTLRVFVDFFRQCPALQSRIEVRFTTPALSIFLLYPAFQCLFTIPGTSVPLMLYPALQYLSARFQWQRCRPCLTKTKRV